MMARLARAADLAYRIISSTRVAAAVMLSWILLLLVWIVPFVFYGLPGERIRGMINGEPFFIAVYVALLVSTVACVIPRTGRVVRKASRLPDPGVEPRFPDLAMRSRALASQGRVVVAVRRAGFRRTVRGDTWVWAVRNRWSGLGTIFFHLSFVILALAVGVTLLANTSFVGEFVLTEGESARIGEGRYLSPEGDGAAPEFDIGVASIEPRFHEDVLLFTRLEAVIDTAGGRTAVSVGNPWHPDPLTNVALTDFGWSLQVTADASTGVTGTVVYDLKVFPSGTPDRIDLLVGDDAYVVDVQVFGDYVDRDGVPGSRSFNADNPRILVSIWRTMTNGEDKLVADSQLLEIGESVDLVGASVSFDDVATHGVFTVTRDPARVLFLAALLVGLAGTAARLLFPRTEVLMWESDDRIAVFARSDVYGRQAQIERRIITHLNRRTQHADR